MSGGAFRLGSESARTYRLKWAAWEWLYQTAGCRCIGFEVRLQGPWGAVIDVVGVGPGNLIYVVEVKSSRPDFARDNHTEGDVERLRRRFASLARRMELASAPGYRDAADASGLDAASPSGSDVAGAYVSDAGSEFGSDAANVSGSDANAGGDLARLRREWQRLRSRLATISTKFHDPRFLAIADYHYIMAPAGVVRTERLPPGWGLLTPEPQPQVIVAAPAKSIRKDGAIVANALRAIARANAGAMMRAHGVRWGEAGAEFPRAE